MRKETMTARQRVTEAINHREPDRMPMDLGMYTASGISAFAYHNLLVHLGLPTDNIEMYEGVQGLARVDDAILRRLHCDCVLLRPHISKYHLWHPRKGYAFSVPEYYNPVLNKSGDWVVERGAQRMRMPADGYFFDGDWITFEDVWEDSIFQAYVCEAERLYKETEYFTAFKGFYPFFQSSMNYFCDIIIEPDEAIDENKRLLKRELERAARLIDNMGGYIGAICMSGDLGCQTSPMMRPESFEQIVLPYLGKLCDFVHRNSDLKVFLHSCGSIEPLLPLLIEAGIDIINPVQISATGMTPDVLKQKYGKNIVFWGGGVDTQKVLGIKSTEAVCENVRKLVGMFKPGGGYVFNSVHNIMGNVKPEDVIAAYDTAYSESFYPIENEVSK